MASKSTHYYDRSRRKGRTYSVTLHFILLLFALFGLPNFMLSRPPVQPMAVSVEILPVSEISNVKPSPTPPAPEPQEAKPSPKEAPPVKTAEDVPPPPPLPTAEPKPAPTPPEPPKPKPKPKPKPDDLAAVLKAVKDTAQKEKKEQKKKEEETAASKTKSDHYDASQPMSLSEVDAIRNQISHCWIPPIGAKDAQNLAVTLRLQLAQDGSVLRVEFSSESMARYNTDSFFRAAADSARRAVQECSPLKNLPQEKYATWRDMEMTFDPKEMLF